MGPRWKIGPILYTAHPKNREGNGKYLRNMNRGQEGDLPPGYRDPLLRFLPVIAHVTGLISPAATGCDSCIRDNFPWRGWWAAFAPAPTLVIHFFFSWTSSGATWCGGGGSPQSSAAAPLIWRGFTGDAMRRSTSSGIRRRKAAVDNIVRGFQCWRR